VTDYQTARIALEYSHILAGLRVTAETARTFTRLAREWPPLEGRDPPLEEMTRDVQAVLDYMGAAHDLDARLYPHGELLWDDSAADEAPPPDDDEDDDDLVAGYNRRFRDGDSPDHGVYYALFGFCDSKWEAFDCIENRATDGVLERVPAQLKAALGALMATHTKVVPHLDRWGPRAADGGYAPGWAHVPRVPPPLVDALDQAADFLDALVGVERGRVGEVVPQGTTPPKGKRPIPAAVIESLLGDESRRVMQIAESEDHDTEKKLRLICAIDRRHLGWTSEQFGQLLGVRSAAIRKTRFWTVERRRLMAENQ
jgi:hypothetical protein